jgi:hypothetical protein
MLWLAAVVTIASAGTIGPSGAATPAQRCGGPPPDTRVGYAVFRPGLNARPAPQKLTLGADLFKCTPAGGTGGTATFAATFKPGGTQTCALVNRAHAINGTAKITWKNGKTSALKVKVALTGASRFANLTGKVSAGLFAGHTFTGQLRYVPFASHHGTTVEQACANKVAPNQKNRNSIVQMHLYRTQPFTIR